MADDLPRLYFRVRENGAAVFRLSPDNRQRRMEMVQVASVNLRSGEVKPHGDLAMDVADRAAIAGWIAARRTQLAAREVDDVLRTVDRLSLAAQWVQARATPEQVEAVADPLLMAMHDLRTVLVRRRADALDSAGDAPAT